jgi:hypothetical protein
VAKVRVYWDRMSHVLLAKELMVEDIVEAVAADTQGLEVTMPLIHCQS